MRRFFSAYAELLGSPHAKRVNVGAILAMVPLAMIGMSITVGVQQAYGSYTLAGALNAVEALCYAAAAPVMGKLADRYGQRRVAAPMVVVWLVAAAAFVVAVEAKASPWVLFCIVPFLAVTPPWAAMNRSRWRHRLAGEPELVPTALALCAVLEECMWVVCNPLSTALSVISPSASLGLAAACIAAGAVLFLGEKETEPPCAVEREDAPAPAARGEKPAMGPGMVAVCAVFFGLGAFQSATGTGIVAFAREQGVANLAGAVIACFSLSSLVGGAFYGAIAWKSSLWKRFYLGLFGLCVGTSLFGLAPALWVIAGIYLVIGLVQSPTFVNGCELVSHLVPEERYTESLALVTAFNAVGSSMGSAVAGPFIDAWGHTGAFAAVAALAAATFAIALAGFRQIKSACDAPAPVSLAIQ